MPFVNGNVANDRMNGAAGANCHVGRAFCSKERVHNANAYTAATRSKVRSCFC